MSETDFKISISYSDAEDKDIVVNSKEKPHQINLKKYHKETITKFKVIALGDEKNYTSDSSEVILEIK